MLDISAKIEKENESRRGRIYLRKENILAFSELATCQPSLKMWKHFKN